MTYSAALEALDRKWGRTVTVEDWRRVGEKSADMLTDDDLVIIENFGGEKSANEARARRAQALAPVAKRAAPALTEQALANVIVKTVTMAIAPLKARNEALELRIKQLEARPLQKWAGVHMTGTQYSEASLVTRAGSLWVAVRTTTTTPGDSSGDWRLIVKKGHA